MSPISWCKCIKAELHWFMMPVLCSSLFSKSVSSRRPALPACVRSHLTHTGWVVIDFSWMSVAAWLMNPNLDSLTEIQQLVMEQFNLTLQPRCLVELVESFIGSISTESNDSCYLDQSRQQSACLTSNFVCQFLSEWITESQLNELCFNLLAASEDEPSRLLLAWPGSLQ